MGLNDFEGKNRDELSMIEVARAILEDHGKRMAFADIVNEVQKYLNKSDEEIRLRLPQFYTDMNTDGRFISMGDNVWALRAWFPYESIDEEVNHPEDEESAKKHHKKVNAFLATATGDDDIIDYDNDDPEDDDLDDTDDDDDNAADDDYDDYDDNEDDEDDSNVLPDGIEGQLSQIQQDDEDDEDDE